MPESLYQYFAEEVFATLGADVQEGLTTLAVAPILDRQLAGALLGPGSAESVCAKALDVGVLVERGQRLELHPLARAFLGELGGQLELRPADGAAEACLRHYRERHDWDAAFEVFARGGPAEPLEDHLACALDELLDTGRLSTVHRWCELADSVGVDAPIVRLASAEVALRSGRHVEAIAFAEAVAARDPTLAFRALSLGGRAAHLLSREEQALSFYRRAEGLASHDVERRDAKWGQLMCLVDLEHPDANSMLEKLCADVTLADPREFVRAAAHRVNLQLRVGPLDLDEADDAVQLLSVVDDPLVESSFLNAYAIALALSARYVDAGAASHRLLELADRHRLLFAIPYSLCVSAMSHSGRREWVRAESAAREALAAADETNDTHSILFGSSVLLRLYAQQGRYDEALRLTARSRGGLPAALAELNCSRALVLACAGRSIEARELVRSSPDTRGVEAVVLGNAVEAVIASKSGTPDALERVRGLEHVAFEIGALDLLVVAYRACPELLTILLRTSKDRRMHSLLARVGDADLAAAAGDPVLDAADRTSLLSPRERDVYELLLTGLTSQQIAKILFIEPSTVKVHTHHIYDKLGVRSRRALAVQAALLRGAQATSATGSASSGGVT
jgi:ATP/maltotriose-dependent transcriptional regulator MalT